MNGKNLLAKKKILNGVLLNNYKYENRNRRRQSNFKEKRLKRLKK